MNYELAKKLKEAGLPQEPFWQVDVNAWGGSWYFVGMKDACPSMVFLEPDSYKEKQPVPIKIPTLSELITECRKFYLGVFYRGFELADSQQDFGWFATMTVKYEAEGETKRIVGHSDNSPEEAVAKLLLELFKA